MYEEALLLPSLWLTVVTHLLHEANGCNYPLDSSEISNDEYPKDEVYNWMQKWAYCVENFITLSLGEEGNHDIMTSKSQKQKKGGGGRTEGALLLFIMEQFIRVHLFTEQHLISLTLTPPPLPHLQFSFICLAGVRNMHLCHPGIRRGNWWRNNNGETMLSNRDA